MAFRHHETSLHRHHQIRILRLSDGRLCVIRAIRLLKLSLKRLHSSGFFDAQVAKIEFVWTFDPLKNRFIIFTKVLFPSRRHTMSSQCLLPSFNFA
jgi:hypothetical protein